MPAPAESSTENSHLINKLGRLGGACARAAWHPATVWSAAEAVIFITAPWWVQLINLSYAGAVWGTGVANELPGQPDQKKNPVRYFLQKKLSPHYTNAGVHVINMAVGAGQLAGLLGGGMGHDEAAMKVAYAGMLGAYYVAAGLQEKSARWLKKQGRLVNLLATPELWLAPMFPAFYPYALEKVCASWGTVNLGFCQPTLLDCELYLAAALTAVVAASTCTRRLSGGKNGFVRRNLGLLAMTGIGAAVAVAGWHNPEVPATMLWSNLLYTVGNIPYFRAEAKQNRLCHDGPTPK
jgi:hypothetical protein